MKTIYKYPFEIKDDFVIEMTEDAEILTVQTQKELPCIWVIVNNNPDLLQITHKFKLFGTGHPMPNNFKGNYVGTFQMYNGNLVYHLFELL
jgi:hypothetical protein